MRPNAPIIYETDGGRTINEVTVSGHSMWPIIQNGETLPTVWAWDDVQIGNIVWHQSGSSNVVHKVIGGSDGHWVTAGIHTQQPNPFTGKGTKTYYAICNEDNYLGTVIK